MAKKKLNESTTDVPQPAKPKAQRVKKVKIKSKQQNTDSIPVESVSEDVFHKPEAIGPRSVELYSLFTDFDVALFKAGKHYKLYEKFGAHVLTMDNGIKGTYFAVWAPNAKYVSVIGNFNGWQKFSHALNVRWDSSGIWEGFIPYIDHGETYKYYIQANSGEELEKADPFALRSEEPPRTASLVANTYYEWNDKEWMSTRHKHNSLNKPVSVYEVHFGSWARSPEDPDIFFSYRDMAKHMVPYVADLGFTHVEFMPLMEHPYYPSWGYQITGYFSATSRYGTPQDLMFLIESFHNAGIGVILDWVPSHFPGDAHGLYRFDGTHLYEHADMRKGFHPDWKSYIFNYGRNEIRAFLISNALFWLDRFHADGLRVDAVASMLYLDYSRKHNEWEPNQFGGNENLEAISLLKELNETVYAFFPDTQMIAEESTSFAGVSRPVFTGGLGFGMKWMMGWMNDTIKYFSRNPVHRKYHHQQITFSTVYAFTENFMLPLSHDEVVHGKGSMLNKMPGDDWQKFANLRLLYSYMFTHPGTKLLFMGCEFGQSAEWNFKYSLDWHLLEYQSHQGIKALVTALNQLYRSEPALYERSFDAEGFEWIDGGNAADSILVYGRKGENPKDNLIIVLNMTPVTREHYRIGTYSKGKWKQIFNSDIHDFWGSGITNQEIIDADEEHWHGKAYSMPVKIAPLAAMVFKAV